MAVLLQFLDPLEVVPIHGVIQLASNSSRAVILRDDVDWAVVWRFALLLLPAGLAGLLVAGIFPVEVGSILIALFALLFVWWPQGLGKIVSCLGSGRRTFIPLGAIAVPQHSVRCDGPRRCACIQIRTASPNGHGGYFRYGSDFWTFGESNALHSRWICVSRPVSFARYRDQRSNRWDLVQYAGQETSSNSLGIYFGWF